MYTVKNNFSPMPLRTT